MPCAQDEAIPVRPFGIMRVVSQMTSPECICHWCCAHRQTGMTTVCLLHSINRESTDCVDREVLKIGRQDYSLQHVMGTFTEQIIHAPQSTRPISPTLDYDHDGLRFPEVIYVT